MWTTLSSPHLSTKNPSLLLDLQGQSHNTPSLDGYAQSTLLYSLLSFRPAKRRNDSLNTVFSFPHRALLSSKHRCEDFPCALLVQPLVFGSLMPSVLGQSFPCCIKYWFQACGTRCQAVSFTNSAKAG